jgi:hypothetical protein
MKPVARRRGLVVRDLPGEVLVYDTDTHRAHCLNRTAGTIFRHADGTRTVGDLVALVGGDGADEGVVRGAIADLAEAGLLEEEAASSASVLSRREVVRRVGIGAAVLLPAVVSVLAPTPAGAAATCVQCCIGQPNGTMCSNDGSQCPGPETCNAGLCSDAGPPC